MSISVKQIDRHVESVLAALEIMDCFLENPKLNIKQIGDTTNMTRNRITRLLGTLMHKGYVMEGIETSTYTPGPKLMALGNIFEENQNLVVLARPILRELALKTGESASFYVREGQERVVLAREEGTQAIRFSVSVGQRMDLHAGAAGKVLLAYAPEAERNIILTKGPLARLTPQTIINPNRLLKELEQIRKSGFAISKGERNPDAFALAAPVFERKNQLIGSIAIAGPISRLTSESEQSYLSDLKKAAHQLSERFGLKND
jgi:DNA-binding IclR family transcriptional regulator